MSPRRILSFFLLLTCALLTGARSGFTQNSSADLLDGFSADASMGEQRWESKFRSLPAPASAREHLRRLTAEPHIAGTKEDYATAVYVRDQMRSYGIPAELK